MLIYTIQTMKNIMHAIIFKWVISELLYENIEQRVCRYTYKLCDIFKYDLQ